MAAFVYILLFTFAFSICIFGSGYNNDYNSEYNFQKAIAKPIDIQWEDSFWLFFVWIGEVWKNI